MIIKLANAIEEANTEDYVNGGRKMFGYAAAATGKGANLLKKSPAAAANITSGSFNGAAVGAMTAPLTKKINDGHAYIGGKMTRNQMQHASTQEEYDHMRRQNIAAGAAVTPIVAAAPLLRKKMFRPTGAAATIGASAMNTAMNLGSNEFGNYARDERLGKK